MLDVKEEGIWVTVGAVDLYDFDPRNKRSGVGIVVDENHRRQGHALEGLGLLSNYAFGHLGVHQLFAEVPCNHNSSLDLFTKAGYSRGESRKDWVMQEGTWIDVILMQKIEEN